MQGMPGLQSKFATRLTRFHGQQGPGFQGRYKARWSRTPPISPGSAITSLSIPFAPELSPPTGWANNGAAASGPACQCNCVMDTSGRRRIAEQTPLTLPASDPTRLVPVRRTVAVSRTRDPKRSLAPIPRPLGEHRGNARRRSHCARRLFWRLGDWPSRLGGGRAHANPPIWRCHRKCPPRRSPKSSAHGGNRRWTPRSKKPASLSRTRQARQKASDGRSPSPRRGEPRWRCRIVGSRRHCRGVIPPPGAAISRRGHGHQRTDPIGSPPSDRILRFL